MTDRKPLSVGMIGYGNIGAGVVKFFRDNNPSEVRLEKIAVQDIDKARKYMYPGPILTTDVQEVIGGGRHNGTDIVVEVMGGYNPAADYIDDAMRRGKHAITANKAMLAKYGRELFETANKFNVALRFEASVCGGIQIINPLLYDNFSRCKIESIEGIINGTNNFILDHMTQGNSMESGIIEAQKEGYAEADHRFDTEGMDTAQKLSLLASLAYGKWFNWEKISRTGILGITDKDIQTGLTAEYAHIIKHMAIVQLNSDGTYETGVHPAYVAVGTDFSLVEGCLNAIELKGQTFGKYFRRSYGAGEGPTATSVYNDIINVATEVSHGLIRPLPTFDEEAVLKSPKPKTIRKYQHEKANIDSMRLAA